MANLVATERPRAARAAHRLDQHATSAADRAIADAVDKAVRVKQQNDDDDPDSGAAGVLAPVG